MDALNNLRNSEKAQQQTQLHQHPQQQQQNEFTTATGAIVANPAITTTSATTSTILSKVGMSGGSVTYTNLGKKEILNKTTMKIEVHLILDTNYRVSTQKKSYLINSSWIFVENGERRKL